MSPIFYVYKLNSATGQWDIQRRFEDVREAQWAIQRFSNNHPGVVFMMITSNGKPENNIQWEPDTVFIGGRPYKKEDMP